MLSVGLIKQQLGRTATAGALRAGASVAAAHITGPPGLPIQLLVELVERTEDQSTRAEEHREHRLLRQDSGREQSFLSLTRSNPFTMKFIAGSRRKHMKSTTTNKGWLMLILVGAADDGDEEPVSIVLWAS